MPTNPAGTANPDDYLLGRGTVYFSLLDSSDHPISYRFLGNAPAVTVTREIESIEHVSSQTGTATVDKEVPTKQSTNVSISLDEISFENLALFFAGNVTTLSNSAAVAGVTGNGNLTLPATNAQGRWYDLYQTATGAPASNPAEDRIYDTGAMSFGTAGSGSVEGTDFEVDKVMGRIFVIDGSAILVAGASYDVDIAANASAATTVDVLQAQTGITVTGAVKFIAENPGNSDKKTQYDFWKVVLKPSGDLALIGEEFAQFQIEGKLEPNNTESPNSPYMTAVDHVNS
jgi:hypothetical protein